MMQQASGHHRVHRSMSERQLVGIACDAAHAGAQPAQRAQVNVDANGGLSDGARAAADFHDCDAAQHGKCVIKGHSLRRIHPTTFCW
jgi:hypothetical protein